jgi:hypothetical protein
VAQTITPRTEALGFLTILHDNNGYMGGYLVTNLWSRPIEFRLSTAVQPNRVQQILYGGTLQSYLCADLIGKTLVEKTTPAAQYIFTDCESVLDLRLHSDVPVLCLSAEGSRSQAQRASPTANSEHGTANLKWPLLCHPKFPSDVAAVRELLDYLDGSLDLAEPFARIREAMSEARKQGALSRN